MVKKSQRVIFYHKTTKKTKDKKRSKCHFISQKTQKTKKKTEKIITEVIKKTFQTLISQLRTATKRKKLSKNVNFMLSKQQNYEKTTQIVIL